MIGAMFYVAAAVVGMDVGWQPLPDGGMEYIIQLEPGTLTLLQKGEVLKSDIPPDIKNVRAYRIVMGKGELPRIDPPPRASAAESAPAPLLLDPAVKRQGVEPATFEQSPTPPTEKQLSPSAPAVSPKTTEPAKPWMPLIVVSLTCFASLGAFAYLLWIHLDLRQRYRKLLQVSLGQTT